MFSLFKKKIEKAELCFNTDIHCHIVPGIDDGSPDVTTSVELVERMKGWGINRIIASPHVTQEAFENTPEIIGQALAPLKSELETKGIDVELSHSAEYRIDEFFLSQLECGNIVPLPGNYLLVENSFLQEPWNLDKILFDLKVRGYKPILAHPERYYYYYNKRSRYDELHNVGTLFQINLLSLAGYYGREEKMIAEYLLEKGYVDFIGTDLHRHAHADAIEAYLLSKEYRKIAPKLHLLNNTL
jgi:tyrosine-protein phosphatase YwqE